LWPNLAFSADGGTLAFLVPSFDVKKETLSLQIIARVWEVATARTLSEIPLSTNQLVVFALAPDGKTLVSDTKDHQEQKYVLTVWEVATGKPRSQSWKLAAPQQDPGVAALAFSYDSRLLVSALRSQTCQVWDTVSGQELVRFKGHEDALHSVAFS